MMITEITLLATNGIALT